MRVLHYALGFPPYRTGGLTKFCMDLMSEQIKEGHCVAMLWPGERRFSKSSKILKRKSMQGVESYEIINPAPISYDEGIIRTDLFIDEGPYECYKEFLIAFKPDVIHLHTLMGVHKNFVVAAEELRIKTVFTAHDFYPICPKVTMFRNGMVCDSVEKCDYCEQCNFTALPLWKINILQSNIYRIIKNTWIMKIARKNHRDAFLRGDTEIVVQTANKANAYKYKHLREYYRSVLSKVDLIHYNSEITKNIYERYLDSFNSLVIPISHGNIADCRRKKEFSTKKIKLTYLGPASQAKGFFLLKEALDELSLVRDDFCLNIFFSISDKLSYIVEHERYTYNQLDDIFSNTDVLIAPSIWYETFGYTVIEALSYGIPVIVTKNVGAKDVIPKGAGIVIEDISVEGLKKAIASINEERLSKMNQIILDSKPMLELNEMEQKMHDKLYGWR